MIAWYQTQTCAVQVNVQTTTKYMKNERKKEKDFTQQLVTILLYKYTKKGSNYQAIISHIAELEENHITEQRVDQTQAHRLHPQ